MEFLDLRMSEGIGDSKIGGFFISKFFSNEEMKQFSICNFPIKEAKRKGRGAFFLERVSRPAA
jgi:hypothetical protein